MPLLVAAGGPYPYALKTFNGPTFFQPRAAASEQAPKMPQWSMPRTTGTQSRSRNTELIARAKQMLAQTSTAGFNENERAKEKVNHRPEKLACQESHQHITITHCHHVRLLGVNHYMYMHLPLIRSPLYHRHTHRMAPFRGQT